MGNKTKNVIVRIDEDLKTKFDDICKENHVNASALIRSWIEEYVRINSEN